MGAITTTSLILAASLVPLAQAACSSLEPVRLPWSNVTLADGIAFNRGIGIQLGGQPVSLRATTLLSNTRLRNSRDCDFGNASVQSGCQGASGSSFDIDQSSTWTSAPQGTWNVTLSDPVQSDETVIDGYDTAQFYSLPEVRGFPFEIWSDLQSDNKSGLALGPNSSFIDTLLSNSLVPSSAFGLFFGSRSQTKGVDGDLIIGGVDRARLAGPWSNFATQAHYIDAQCPLQVLVKDIRLNNDRGSFSLFADSDATVIACIDPLQNQFTLTETMYNIFASLTEHANDPGIEGGSDFTEQTYPLSAAPLLGNITVELSNGYTTHVPSYEFVSQERGTDLEGKYAVVNESRLMVAAGTTGTSTLDGVQIPILGGVYLSQNYLMVDYDSGIFRLAPAVLGEMPDQAHDIVQLCGGIEVDQSSSSSSTGKGSNSHAGAIAGGVIGGVAILAIAAVMIWYLKKKKKKQKREPALQPMAEAADQRAADAPELYRNGFRQDSTPSQSQVTDFRAGRYQLE